MLVQIAQHHDDTLAFYERHGNPHKISYHDTVPLSEQDFWHAMHLGIDGGSVITNGFHLTDGWYGWCRAFWNSYGGYWMLAIRAEKYEGLETKKKVIYRKWSKCNHRFSLTVNKTTYREYTCDHCGYKQVVDSSD